MPVCACVKASILSCSPAAIIIAFSIYNEIQLIFNEINSIVLHLRNILSSYPKTLTVRNKTFIMCDTRPLQSLGNLTEKNIYDDDKILQVRIRV